MLESFRDVVRAEATERTWSQGVALARDGRVIGRAKRGDELELEVRVPGRPTPFEVQLNPKHDEWECTCTSREPVCSHVVAAILAAVQADSSGEPLPIGNIARPLAQLRYLLSPSPGGVIVDRQLVRKSGNELLTEPLTASLMSLVAAGKAGGIATIDADLLADQLLTARVGPVNGERLDRLLGVLADARDVQWMGEPVTTNPEPVKPRVVVEDSPGGVRVRIEADPSVREVVTVGVVRTRDRVLRPIGDVDLSGPRLDKLPQVWDVPRSAFPDLIGTMLPQLAQRIEIDVRAKSLPTVGVKEQPRMAFDVEQDGDRLRVLPSLVYGDPPRARVDGQVLVHIEGSLPIRNHDEERKLTHRLRDELNLVPGRR
ncbi:MAG TPA: helicase, partial [Kofleriaceae bacterium]|nr:helicase [Kofleriaceae bacterium]